MPSNDESTVVEGYDSQIDLDDGTMVSDNMTTMSGPW